MGDGSLDSVLAGAVFLDVRHHPEAAFRVTAVRGDGNPLAYGRMSVASVSGTFRLKGKEVPLEMAVEMEPVLGADNQPLLLARGMFRIDLEVFGIEGADGPAPANRSLVFDLFLPFEPDPG
jgi:polyisoprenoid-binding protein YceI